MLKAIIVIPTYNEKDNVSELIEQVLKQQINIKEYELNVLISDSHSTDGTLDIVNKIKKTNKHVYLLDVNERGIGVGLLKGYQYAIENLSADIIIQMDADLQHNPSDLPRFLAEFKNDINFVQGSRFIKGGSNNLEWYRQFFSWGANFVARLLMGFWQIHEFTTSYRAFTTKLFKKINISEIPWKGNSFIFQPAFLYGAIEAGANIKEIPIIFTDRKKGYSKMNTIGYITDLLVFASKVRIKKSIRLIKFASVGTGGLIINTIVLRFLVEKYYWNPALANIIGAELAIISNFIFNNFWTFNDRKLKTKKEAILKFIQFNITSLGSIIISSTIVALGVFFLGKTNYIIYYFVGVATAMFWNYFIYSRVIWKKK